MNKFTRFLYLIRNVVISVLNIFPSKKLKNIYWNIRAKEIDKRYGYEEYDYENIANIIDKYNIKSVLDFGCGSGRIFKVLLDKKVPVIVGQDISSNAIKILRKRYPEGKYTIHNEDIYKLNYPENYFDLIISNRALSAVKSENIDNMVIYLSKMAKMLYINEYTENDKNIKTNYWYLHNYYEILKNIDFSQIEKGIYKNNYEWFLYKNTKI